MTSITITNQKVIDFFTRNPSVDADTLMANVIDFYEYVMSTMSNGNTNQLLAYVVDQSSKLDAFKHDVASSMQHLRTFLDSTSSATTLQFSSLNDKIDSYKSDIEAVKSIDKLNTQVLQSDLSTIKQSLGQLNQDITTSIVSKFFDLKTSYVDDLKTIVFQHETDNMDKIHTALANHNASLVTSTSAIINELFPKLSSQQNDDISRVLTSFRDQLCQDTKSIVASSSDIVSSLSDNVNTKLNELQTNLHQPLFALLSSSESRLSSTLDQLKDIATNNASKAVSLDDQFCNLQNNLTQFLNLFNNSSQKGRMSENLLYNVLTRAFPSADIVDSTGDPHSCDFRLKRLGKQDVLIENKTYTRNVDLDELRKFHEDVDKNDCSAILISQSSGITHKENWQIDLHNGNVMIYLHQLNYNQESLQLAVRVIDHLHEKLSEVGADVDHLAISHDFLQQLNNEFQFFIKQRDNLLNFLRSQHKETLAKIKELQLPHLHNFLSSRFAVQASTEFRCKWCDFSASTQQGINGHSKGCKNKP